MAIRVLVVDDSVFMRSMLKGALADSAGIEVIGTAMNGTEGLKKIRELKPDVVTLDVEMPGLTGLQVLETVMKECPTPVVVVSTKTQEGARTTLDALQLGAVDYVAKPLADKNASLEGFRAGVVRAVQTAAVANKRHLTGKRGPVPAARPMADFSPDAVVAIGISAGGPQTLHQMIPAFPAKFPPVLITQHMPEGFTGPFANRLNDQAQGEVLEARDGDPIAPGHIYIAPGSHHLRLAKKNGRLVTSLDGGPKVSGFRPSVDVLFESVSGLVGGSAVGVVMTGMGCDGSVGIRLLKAKGAATIAQDQETSIVYGMPKAAKETGCIDRICALGEIPTAIAEALSAHVVGAH